MNDIACRNCGRHGYLPGRGLCSRCHASPRIRQRFPTLSHVPHAPGVRRPNTLPRAVKLAVLKRMAWHALRVKRKLSAAEFSKIRPMPEQEIL